MVNSSQRNRYRHRSPLCRCGHSQARSCRRKGIHSIQTMVLQNLQVLVLNTHKQKVPLFSSLMNHFYKSGILYNIAFYFKHKIFVIQQHATEKETKKKRKLSPSDTGRICQYCRGSDKNAAQNLTAPFSS